MKKRVPGEVWLYGRKAAKLLTSPGPLGYKIIVPYENVQLVRSPIGESR